MEGPQHGVVITPFVWLMLAASLVAMAAQRIRIPYALALVITGLLIGAPHLLPSVHLEPVTLFTVFLPPLLFESALNLRWDTLQREWRPIALYALGGTLVAAFVVGWLGTWVLQLPLSIALVFGALISPTDPISVIALFKRLGVQRRLSVIVEAESLFNDGVAVVLFSVLLEAVSHGAGIQPGPAVTRFLAVVLGGAGVGVVLGWITSRVTRYFDDHLLEITLTTIVAFGSYLSAEALHVSGVIAVVASGLVVGNYGMATGMSPTTRLAVSSFWEYAAFAANSIVFLLVGLEITYLDLHGELLAIVAAVTVVLAGRALSVYGMSLLANALQVRISWACQHVLVWGGVRGALSMALVLGLAPDFPHRDFLVVVTFGVVLFSLLVQGLTLPGLLRRLGVTEVQRSAEYQRLAGTIFAARAALGEVNRLCEAGLAPRQACEEVAEEYEQRIQGLEAQVQELHLEDRELLNRQRRAIRTRALLAEKSALQEAQRGGILSDEEYQRCEHAIDQQLAKLQAEH